MRKAFDQLHARAIVHREADIEIRLEALRLTAIDFLNNGHGPQL